LFLVIFLILTFFPDTTDTNFYPYKVPAKKYQDSLFKANLDLISRINRIEPGLIRKGMIVWLPKDFQWAKIWAPLPESLPEEKELEKLIFVDLSEQWFGAYEKGKLIFSGPISSGRNTSDVGRWRTPCGRFKILWKDTLIYSYRYKMPNNNTPEPDDSLPTPMPYSLGFTKNNLYFLHAGVLPGYPASHGCIRLFYLDAKRLFEWAEIGTPLIIIK
jgi:lipoprotein-anchoring transpeptidase ErfK/SrfK